MNPEAEFESLWQACQKKVGKGAAEKAYLKARKSGKMPGVETVIARLVALQASEAWSKDGRQFQPHLATWLNREGWNDEPTKAKYAPSAKANGHQVADWKSEIFLNMLAWAWKNDPQNKREEEFEKAAEAIRLSNDQGEVLKIARGFCR